MTPEPSSLVPQDSLTLFGAPSSGAVAVDATLTLLDIPFTVIEGATWASEAARERVGSRNSMRQIPTLVLPDGEILTESAAILLYLADKHPAACLGSNLVSTYDNDPDRMSLPLGGLDQAPSNKVEGDFFVGSEAPWFEITDGLPQHDTWPGSRTEVRKTSDEN